MKGVERHIVGMAVSAVKADGVSSVCGMKADIFEGAGRDLA